MNFLKQQLKNCGEVIRTKLQLGLQTKEQSESNLSRTQERLDSLKKDTEEAKRKLKETFDEFFKEASQQFYDFLQSASFKSKMFLNTEKFTRFGIADELKKRIENAIIFWQQKYIKDLFRKAVMKHLADTFNKIHERLDEIKQEMQGIKKGFSVTKRHVGAVASSVGTGTSAFVAFGILVTFNAIVAVVVGAVGLASALVLGAVIVSKATKNFETIREDSFKAIIDPLSKEEIEKKMREYYEEQLKNEMAAFMQELQSEIVHLKTSCDNMKRERDHYRNDIDNLRSLNLEIVHFREQISAVECLYIWDMSAATQWNP